MRHFEEHGPHVIGSDDVITTQDAEFCGAWIESHAIAARLDTLPYADAFRFSNETVRPIEILLFGRNAEGRAMTFEMISQSPRRLESGCIGHVGRNATRP